jgi:hypothetical protein
MPVEIAELEVVPSAAAGGETQSAGEQGDQQRPAPEAIRAEVERALAIRRERAERLRAT